jgi:hypothetical protein
MRQQEAARQNVPGTPVAQAYPNVSPMNQLSAIAGSRVTRYAGITASERQRTAYNLAMLELRREGKRVVGFGEWRDRQEGPMGFDYGAVSFTPGGLSAARANLDERRLQDQMEQLGDPSTAGYYRGLAKLYRFVGRDAQAKIAEERAFTLTRLGVEAGHEAAADKRKAAVTEAGRAHDIAVLEKTHELGLAQWAGEQNIKREQMESRERIARIKAAPAQLKGQISNRSGRARAIRGQLTPMWKRWGTLDEQYELARVKAEGPPNTKKGETVEGNVANVQGVVNNMTRLKETMEPLLGELDQLEKEIDALLEPEDEELTEDMAREILAEAGGDPEKARALAKERGFTIPK